MHRRLHGVGTRDVGYEQLWNAAKDEPGKLSIWVLDAQLPELLMSGNLAVYSRYLKTRQVQFLIGQFEAKPDILIPDHSKTGQIVLTIF
jgi:prophage antirepressor-like protein